jgi:hypothetical protein
MRAKHFVESIRRDFDFHLPLSRYRDLIARLVYGRSYSAAIAAERA